jgi:hypothetical protein
MLFFSFGRVYSGFGKPCLEALHSEPVVGMEIRRDPAATVELREASMSDFVEQDE